MSATELSLDDFLGHSGQSNSKAKYLSGWKKQGSVNVFLHTKAPIISLWQHGIPTVVKINRDGQDVLEVWNKPYNCFEEEPLLKQQNRFDPNTGKRAFPPERCPVCKLVEWFRDQVKSGRIKWTAEVFRFEGDDPSKNVVIHAAGLFNGFAGDMEDHEVKELKVAGIFRNKAWSENMMAKLHYLFRVVDAANPAVGVQKALETGLLGDKVKRVIFDARKSKGDDAGNPLKNPYCIGWEFHPNELEFSKKYHALPIDKIKPTREIMRLIRETDPPDVSFDIAKPNLDLLRASLEKACLVSGVPWDTIFKKPSGYVAPEDFPFGANAPAEEDDKDMVECDKCGKLMKVTDSTCPHCGHEYEVQAEPPKPPPPSPRKRSEAKKASPPPAVQAKGEDVDDVPFLSVRVSLLSPTDESPLRSPPGWGLSLSKIPQPGLSN